MPRGETDAKDIQTRRHINGEKQFQHFRILLEVESAISRHVQFEVFAF